MSEKVSAPRSVRLFQASPRDSYVHPTPPPHADELEEISSTLIKPHLKTHSEIAKSYASYFVRHWKIFLICLTVYLAILAAVVAVIFTISANYANESKELARSGVMAGVHHETLARLTEFSERLPALGLSVLSFSNCTDIVSAFPSLSETILDDRDNPIRYYFDAAGEVASIYPPIDFDGMYHSNHSFMESQDDEYIRVMNRREVSMGLPFNHPDGYLAAYMSYPLWAPAAHASADVLCDSYSYSNCTDDCWNPDLKIKFIGMVRALIDLSHVLSPAATEMIDELIPDFDFCIHVKKEFSDDELQRIHCTSSHPKDPVMGSFSVFGLTFVVALTRFDRWNENFDDTWAAPWKYRLTFFMTVGILPFCMLLYWALASQEKYMRLLSSILPRRVIDHLGLSTGVFSEEFTDVTILFSDICSFTPLAARLTPIQIVGMLDELYSLYDALTLKHAVYKIETIGDAYMVSCGCPEKVGPKTAALRMVAMAKDMLLVASNFRPSYMPKGVPFRVRVGINSGGVVAGVVGRTMPRYCLFGDVVNTASRMESSCDPMKIQISDTTFKLIEDSGVAVIARGFVEIKGKGSMKTYYVDLGEAAIVTDPSVSQSISVHSNPTSVKNVAFSWRPGRGSSLADDDDFSNSFWRNSTPHRSRTNTFDGSIAGSVADSPKPSQIVESYVYRNVKSLSARLTHTNTSGKNGTSSPLPGGQLCNTNHGQFSTPRSYKYVEKTDDDESMRRITVPANIAKLNEEAVDEGVETK
jgi:class 3 adenylate cyclase